MGNPTKERAKCNSIMKATNQPARLFFVLCSFRQYSVLPVFRSMLLFCSSYCRVQGHFPSPCGQAPCWSSSPNTDDTHFLPAPAPCHWLILFCVHPILCYPLLHCSDLFEQPFSSVTTLVGGKGHSNNGSQVWLLLLSLVHISSPKNCPGIYS